MFSRKQHDGLTILAGDLGNGPQFTVEIRTTLPPISAESDGKAHAQQAKEAAAKANRYMVALKTLLTLPEGMTLRYRDLAQPSPGAPVARLVFNSPGYWTLDNETGRRISVSQKGEKMDQAFERAFEEAHVKAVEKMSRLPSRLKGTVASR